MSPDVFFLIITGVALIGIVSYFLFGKKKHPDDQVHAHKEALEAK